MSIDKKVSHVIFKATRISHFLASLAHGQEPAAFAEAGDEDRFDALIVKLDEMDAFLSERCAARVKLMQELRTFEQSQIAPIVPRALSQPTLTVVPVAARDGGDQT